MQNVNRKVVEDFGHEWAHYDQSGVPTEELVPQFDAYFAVFPWDKLPPEPVGFDLGCGSGRWGRLVAPRVGQLHLIDASEMALQVAERQLADLKNCVFHHASIDSIPLPDESMDFGYCLGVLHHVPDPAAGIAACVKKLKRGAPMLFYIYYAFDNRKPWYRWLWKASELGRIVISRLPSPLKIPITQVIAATVYLPLARTAKLAERAGADVSSFPLSAYRDSSFYSMRTDALDRFGTRMEKRFTRVEIERMLRAAGLTDIRFYDGVPYWCVSGIRA